MLQLVTRNGYLEMSMKKFVGIIKKLLDRLAPMIPTREGRMFLRRCRYHQEVA